MIKAYSKMIGFTVIFFSIASLFSFSDIVILKLSLSMFIIVMLSSIIKEW
jgi:hypothetical protein